MTVRTIVSFNLTIYHVEILLCISLCIVVFCEGQEAQRNENNNNNNNNIQFNSIKFSAHVCPPPLSLFLLLSLPSPPYYIVTLSNGEREEKRDSMCTQSDALRPRA